jgi:hypothetical protein
LRPRASRPEIEIKIEIETAPTTDTTTATIRIATIGTTTKAVPTNPGKRLATEHIGNSPG